MASTVVPTQVEGLSSWVRYKLPLDLSFEWPDRFDRAVRPGADLSGVWDAWCAWALDGLIADAPAGADLSVVRDIRSLFEDPAAVESRQWQQAVTSVFQVSNRLKLSAHESEAASWAGWATEAAGMAVCSRAEFGANAMIAARGVASVACLARTEWISHEARHADGRAKKRLNRLWRKVFDRWAVDVADALIELIETAPVAVPGR